jgi:hypothetical protein
LTQGYLEKALILALNRLEMAPVGAFKLDIGPEMPTYYVLIPATLAETLVALDGRLGKDAEYVKATSGFRDAPASAPAFVRAERTLLSAFAGWPKVVTPKKEKRIFQLRITRARARLRMRARFRSSTTEIEIFTRTGLTPVFFGETLIGTRMPSLPYMLTYTDTAELAQSRRSRLVRRGKELSHRPGNMDAEIVSNISKLYLTPLSCSQI